MAKLFVKSVSCPSSEPFALADGTNWIMLNTTKSWLTERLDLVLDLEISIVGSLGSEYFSLRLRDPRSKETRQRWNRDRSLTVIQRDWAQVRRKIENRVSLCEGNTDSTTLMSLRKYFLWEFEGNIREGLN